MLLFLSSLPVIVWGVTAFGGFTGICLGMVTARRRPLTRALVGGAIGAAILGLPSAAAFAAQPSLTQDWADAAPRRSALTPHYMAGIAVGREATGAAPRTS